MKTVGVLSWFLDANTREEVLGDIVELQRSRSVPAFCWDVLSIVVRTRRAREWGGIAVVLMLTIGSALTRPGQPLRTVIARDPAGSFSLVFRGPRVVSASVDGVPVPAARMVQTVDRLVIHGGDGNQDLEIHLRPDGSFGWQGRLPRVSIPQ